MQTREKSTSAAGAATQQGGPAVATAGDKANVQQAWNGYVQGLAPGAAGEGRPGEGGPVERDGPVGDGGGLRRMFTARVPVPGTGEFMYVGKWYFRNVTESQVKAYDRHGQKTDGWFEITKTQYEIQHGATNKSGKVTRKANPEAWTYHVRGPGGAVVKREKMNFQDAVQTDEEGLFWPPDRTSATIEVDMSPPPATACTATLRALAADGSVRVVNTIPIAAGQKSFQTSYVLAKDEALQIVFDLPGQGPLIQVSALVKTTQGGKSQASFDNMDAYGQEMPSDDDVRALLAQRRKGR